MKKITVDRIEGGFAVCENADLSHEDIPLSCFPFPVHEGSVITVNDDGSFSEDVEEEDEMRKKIIELQNRLRNKNKM